jgi:hypothetical protein
MDGTKPTTSEYDIQGPTSFHQSMLVAHVNGCCMETCANIKLLLFLHVPISLKKLSFNIVERGMDLIVEVLPPCVWTLLIHTFMTPNLMMKKPL